MQAAASQARRQIWLVAVVKGHHELGAAASDSGSGCLGNAAPHSEPHCAACVLQRVQPVLGNNRPARGTSQLHIQVLSSQFDN
jgi:hypothetical protein